MRTAQASAIQTAASGAAPLGAKISGNRSRSTRYTLTRSDPTSLVHQSTRWRSLSFARFRGMALLLFADRLAYPLTSRVDDGVCEFLGALLPEVARVLRKVEFGVLLLSDE